MVEGGYFGGQTIRGMVRNRSYPDRSEREIHILAEPALLDIEQCLMVQGRPLGSLVGAAAHIGPWLAHYSDALVEGEALHPHLPQSVA